MASRRSVLQAERRSEDLDEDHVQARDQVREGRQVIRAPSRTATIAARRTMWALSLVLVTGLGAPGCGYRPEGVVLPDQYTAIYVAHPRPARTDEPQTSRLLVVALRHELARRGVRSASGPSPHTATLRTKLLALEGGRPIVDGTAPVMVARRLGLRLELALLSAAGEVLWRSGVVEVDHTWPLGRAADPLAQQGARQQAIEALCQRAARQAVDLMMTGL